MRLRDRTCVLLLAAAPAILFFGVLLAGKAWMPRHSGVQDLPWATTAAGQFSTEPFNSTFSDPVNLLLPDLAFAGSEVASGRLPLWNPWLLCGNAHAANPIAGVFYPPTLLAALMPAMDAQLAIAAFHLLIAGVFFYFWMRMLGLRPACALFGAAAFQCSGWVAAHLHNFPIVGALAWVVLALGAVDWRLRSGNRRSLVLLAVGLAMSWLAGFPQVAALGSIAVASYAGIQILQRSRRDSWRSAKAHAFPVLAALLLGTLLAAVQIVPALQQATQSARGARSGADLSGECLRAPAILGWLLPTTLGDPMLAGDWREDLAARMVLGEGPELKPAGCMNWSERTLAPGWITLTLALCCLPLLRNPALLAFAIITLLALLHAFIPLFATWAAAIPGLNLGAPSRSVVLLALLLPALAATGLDALLHRLEYEGRGGFVRMRRILWGVVLLLAVGCAALWSYEDQALRAGVCALQDGGMEARFAAPPRAPEEWMDPLRPHFVRLRMDLTRGVVALLAGLLCFELLCRRRAVSAVLLLTGICVWELLHFAVPPNLPVTKVQLFEPTPGLRFLQANTTDERMVRVANNRAEALQDSDRFLVPNLPSLFALRDVQGWREQIPRTSLLLWSGVVAGTSQVAVSGIEASAAGSRVLDIAHVRWLVAPRPVPALDKTQVYPSAGASNSDLWIYENTDRCPRAWLVHHALRMDDTQAAQQLHAAAIDPLRTALLAPDAPEVALASPASEESCRVSWECSDAVDITVDAAAPGLLVLSQTFDEGWEAQSVCAGIATTLPVMRANVAFSAIPIAPGHHLITLRYRPPSVRLGMALRGGAVLLLLGLLFVRRSPAERGRHS